MRAKARFGVVLVAVGVGVVRLLLQHVRRPGRSDQDAVGAGGEPAAAPQRSDSRTWWRRSRASRSRSGTSSARSPTRARSWPARRRPEQTIAGGQRAERRARRGCWSSSRTIRSCGRTRSFNRLMDELAGTENRIAVERMRYNERVQEYNTSAPAVSRRTSRPASSGSRTLSAVQRATGGGAGAEGELRGA